MTDQIFNLRQYSERPSPRKFFGENQNMKQSPPGKKILYGRDKRLISFCVVMQLKHFLSQKNPF